MSGLRLVGVHEIADLLSVSRQRVHQLASVEEFPRPVAVLVAGAVWNRDDVEQWRDRMRPFGKAGRTKVEVPLRDPERPQDDPWDANAVRYLLNTREGSAWRRGDLMECLRRQANRLARQPERVAEAERLAAQHHVDCHPDPGGQTIHFFRTDRGAPRTYPASAAERRAWLRSSP